MFESDESITPIHVSFMVHRDPYGSNFATIIKQILDVRFITFVRQRTHIYCILLHIPQMPFQRLVVVLIDIVNSFEMVQLFLQVLGLFFVQLLHAGVVNHFYLVSARG